MQSTTGLYDMIQTTASGKQPGKTPGAGGGGRGAGGGETESEREREIFVACA